MLSRGLLVATASLLCMAAASAPVRTYSGEYFYNFENAVLTPKGSNERWCINGDMSTAELPGKNGKPGWGTAQVTVRGILGPKGNFGSLGSCTRELKVSAVVAVRERKAR